MGLTMPDTWERRLIGDNVMWVHHMDIKCMACGKSERVMVMVFEGKFNEELMEDVKTSNGVEKVYPTLAPNGRMEWKVPKGWTQIIHVTSNFYPNEILTAIHMNMQQVWEFAKLMALNHNWSEFVKSDGVSYKIERQTTWRDIFRNPIRVIKDILHPEKIIITFDESKLKDEMRSLWYHILSNIDQQIMTPQQAFEKWYSETQQHFAEWVCESDECWYAAAKGIRAEFNTMRELAQAR